MKAICHKSGKNIFELKNENPRSVRVVSIIEERKYISDRYNISSGAIVPKKTIEFNNTFKNFYPYLFTYSLVNPTIYKGVLQDETDFSATIQLSGHYLFTFFLCHQPEKSE